MGIQADVKDALDASRDDLLRVLAENRIRPTVVDRGGSEGSSLLGKPTAPTFKLESEDGESGFIDRQTTMRVVDTLGLSSEEDCEEVRSELENHPDWDGA